MFERPLSRREVPGLTFVFSLPEPATSMADFHENAPCVLWKPGREFLAGPDGRLLAGPDGRGLFRIVYAKGKIELPFSQLKKACLEQAHQDLPPGTPFEIRLGLPMGLDDPGTTAEKDLWRIGFVNYPEMSKAQEKRGLRSKFGYYLLAKRIAGTKIILDTEEGQADLGVFIGAERGQWADRFRKFA